MTAETAPVEPLAPRRMDRRRDKRVHQASAVSSFDLLRLPAYPTGCALDRSVPTAPAASSLSTTQSVESEMMRSKPWCDRTFLNPQQ